MLPLHFGPIDILFNNAGMNIRKRFEDYTEAEFDRIFDVHMKGMFFMAQAVYPAMAARGRGCIINVASQRGLKGAVNSAPYSAAKAAIMGFTRALSWEAAPKGRAGQRHRARPDRHRPDRHHGHQPIGRPSSMRSRCTDLAARGDRRHGIAARRTGWRVLCRGDAVAERRRRDALIGRLHPAAGLPTFKPYALSTVRRLG